MDLHRSLKGERVMTNKTTDFNAVDHGSVVLLQPITADAATWAEEHLPEDAPRFGSGYAIEKNYICEILQGIECDGLTWGQR